MENNDEPGGKVYNMEDFRKPGGKVYNMENLRKPNKDTTPLGRMTRRQFLAATGAALIAGTTALAFTQREKRRLNQSFDTKEIFAGEIEIIPSGLNIRDRAGIPESREDDAYSKIEWGNIKSINNTYIDHLAGFTIENPEIVHEDDPDGKAARAPWIKLSLKMENGIGLFGYVSISEQTSKRVIKDKNGAFEAVKFDQNNKPHSESVPTNRVGIIKPLLP